MHAFDMLDPDSELAKMAAEKFNQHFAYAVGHYFCEQIESPAENSICLAIKKRG